jgi:prepilin-type N-terminal cleavage/methylation domain-containing protein
MSARSTSLFTPSTPFSPGPQTGRAQGSGFRVQESGVRCSALRTPHSALATPRPSAFTLVELLTVITIIGILAGLATVAAYQAFGTAKGAAIKTDITNLESAFEQYKMNFGQYPPSDMTNIDQIRRHLLKAFPRCNVDEEMKYIPRGDGTDYGTPYTTATVDATNAMTPAQALAFWLRGFSSNKQKPLSALANPDVERIGLLEFQGRLVNPNTKDAWTALDPIPPVFKAPYGDQPYVYFEARSYLSHNLVPLPLSTSSTETCYPYMWDSNGDEILDAKDWDANLNLVLDDTEFSKIYANPKSFQIISAGVDGAFGNPTSSVPKDFPRNGTPNKITVDVPKVYAFGEGYTDEDNDNMTNFSERALGDAKPE